MRIEPELFADGVFTIESGYAAMRRLLEQRPDSLFAANDLMAAGALLAIDEAGLRAPDDIAVVGFDDLPIAATTSPPLSTIRQDLATVGAVAVDLLVRLLGPDPDSVPLRSLVETSLVVRGSTRPIADDVVVTNPEGMREDASSRIPVAASTFTQQNRRATPS
jgi:LacI family transcriptional regulator